MSVCIHYARPASGKGEGEVFGLDVAVNNLLSAYFRYGHQDKFFCRPTDMPSFEHFKSLATAAGQPPDKCVGLDPRYPRHNMIPITTLFRPDPLIGELSWQRHQVAGPGYSLCGLVHTMSGERIAQAVGDLCTAPVDGGDALICPSTAIRDAVHNLWSIQADYLNFRFKSNFECPVQTPVIPLGIETEKFKRLTTADKRKAQRAALQIADDEIVLLAYGRMSFATKSHPLPLWQAAESAAKRTQRKLRVVMFGYFKPADMEKHYRVLAADICKTVALDFVTNDDVRFPDGFWAGADIFASLSDNVQESFGLTPIEAMAAGLPVIASDWDGYRDTVRNGIDGFLIPTVAPPPSAGQAVAEAYYNEQNYGVALMGASQSTSVDPFLCSEAILALAEDSNLRRTFAGNGRKRAEDIFDWKHVIKAYEELWAELADKRRNRTPGPSFPPNWPAAHPGYVNPFTMFRGFPSRILMPGDCVQIVASDEEIATIMKHEMNYFLPDLLLPKHMMLELIDVIRRAGSAFAKDILAPFPATEHDRLMRCLGWMLKHGIARSVQI